MNEVLRKAADDANTGLGWILGVMFDDAVGLDPDANVKRAESDLASALQSLATFRATRVKE